MSVSPDHHRHNKKSASSVTTSSYGVDTNWYMDSGTASSTS
jgi:hypothetical protein